jgi:hypothetical protein
MYKNDSPTSIQFLIKRVQERVAKIHPPVIRLDDNTVGSEFIEGIDRLLD